MPQFFHLLPRSLMPVLLLAAKASAAIEISAPVTAQYHSADHQKTFTAVSTALAWKLVGKTPAARDSAINHELALSLTTSQPQVEIGDLVTLTLTFANHTGATLPTYTINANLPQGIKLIDGWVKLDGQAFNQVNRLSSKQVRFDIANLTADEIHTLSFAVQITASSAIESVISAYANAGSLHSTLVQAKVSKSRKGLLSEEGAIFGKVSFPTQCTAAQKSEILPIGGVRIYLEDGRFAVTDASGDYNFQAVKPGMHSLKVDKITLPKGLKLTLSTNQQIGDASSQLIEMTQGGYQRADFSAECPTHALEKTIAAVKKFNAKLKDTDVFEQGERKTSPELIGPFLEDDTSQPTTHNTEIKPLSTKDALQAVKAAQVGRGNWLWPQTEVSTDGRFMAALPLTSTQVALYVNNQAVPESQLGEQLGDKAKQLQVATWYGVKLEQGKNTIELRTKDKNGKEISVLKSTFVKPSRGVRLEVTPEVNELPADGRVSKVPIKVRVLDDEGNIAAGDYFLTLQASEGSWAGADLQEAIPGHQVLIHQGEGVVHLRSSYNTGKVGIKITSEQMRGEAKLIQTAAMRPLIATGYLDITAHKGDISTDKMKGEAKLFVKGKVKGNLHLTFAYDSTKHNDDKYSYNSYLQDENDRSYFPARGDASMRDQEARSKSKTYLKLEKGQNSVLYGDYALDSTELEGDTEASRLDLARDPRYLTGVLAHYGDARTEVDVFAAQQNNRHFVELIPGNGTSMNFQVGQGSLVPNSALVELLVQDKNNLGLILSISTLERVTDYTLDDVSGNLNFHRVIPSYDQQLNPIYIRVSYDREGTNDQSYTVAGARVKHSLTDTVRVGGSYTQDEHPTAGYTVSGAYIDYQPNDKTRISASEAQMEHANGAEAGSAYRVQATQQWSKEASTSATLLKVDKGFTSSGGLGLSAGRLEARIDHLQKLSPNSDLKLEGIHSEATSTNTAQQALGARAETNIGEWRVGGGVRHLERQSPQTSSTHNTALVSAKRSLKVFGRSGKVAAEYEQDVGNADFNHLYADGELQVSASTSVYTKYDHGNDLLGTAGLSDDQRRSLLSIGSKARVNSATELYSEYRSEGIFANTDTINAETATGVKGNYLIKQGLTVSPALEIVKVNEGQVLENATAVSVAITDKRNKEHQKYLKVEGRNGSRADYYAATGNYSAKLSQDWSGVVSDDIRRESSATGATFNNTLTVGAAHRPAKEGRFNSQYMYQLKTEDGAGKASDRTTHIASTWQNVQINNRAQLAGRLAGKQQQVKADNEAAVTSNSVLVDATLNYNINDKLDAELHGGVIQAGGNVQHAAGVGVNMQVAENWRIGVGYNATGFNDKDLDTNRKNAQGMYVRVQTKIGEDMFKSIQPQEPDTNSDSLF